LARPGLPSTTARSQPAPSCARTPCYKGPTSSSWRRVEDQPGRRPGCIRRARPWRPERAHRHDLETEYKANRSASTSPSPLQLAASRPPPAPGAAGVPDPRRRARRPTSRRIAATPWDSGEVASDKSTRSSYGGRAVAIAGRYYWKVRVWDANGRRSAWSSVAFFEMGLLSSADWTAHWMRRAHGEAAGAHCCASVRSSPAPSAARASMPPRWVSTSCSSTATGVGQDYFNPRVTAYAKRLEYQTYDVTGLIVRGHNALGAIPWQRLVCVPRAGSTLRSRAPRARCACSSRSSSRQHDRTRRLRWLLARLDDGPIESSSIYDGEIYDGPEGRARLVHRPLCRFRLGARPRSRRLSRHAGRGRLPHPGDAGPVPGRDHDPGRRDLHLRHGAEHRGLGPPARPGRGRHRRAPCASRKRSTPTARSTRRTPRRRSDRSLQSCAAPAAPSLEPHFTYHGFRYVEVPGFHGVPGRGAITGRRGSRRPSRRRGVHSSRALRWIGSTSAAQDVAIGLSGAAEVSSCRARRWRRALPRSAGARRCGRAWTRRRAQPTMFCPMSKM